MEPTVTLSRCPAYDQAWLAESLRKLLEPLGGIESFVSCDQHVLIKPNLLSDREPDQAVTTHPELVRAIIRAIKPTGARISVGDSPASATKLKEVWAKSGFAALCKEEKVDLISLEQSGSTLRSRDGFSFHLANPVLEADVVINVPKIKTHVLTTLTCSVKNLYGCIPGYQKAELHKRHPKSTPDDFGGLLKAIHAEVAPALTIADGVVGMQGDGPSGGTPAKLGFLAASASAYALDAAVCDILSLPRASVPYLHASDRYRILPQHTSVREYAPRSFALPNTARARLIPAWLVRAVAPFLWIRPAFDHHCIRCARCVKACPVEALTLKKSGKTPRLTPSACIGCCCCHEMCPVNAITMRASPPLRFASFLRSAAQLLRAGGKQE